jgi:hypothetical protein
VADDDAPPQKNTDIWTNSPSLVAALRGSSARATRHPFKCSRTRPCCTRRCGAKRLKAGEHAEVRGSTGSHTPFPYDLAGFLAHRVLDDILARR